MNDFSKYQNLIRAAAHKYAALWHLDYDDMEAQGYLVYCEALERYDITRAGFSTYLTHRLRTLNDYAKTQIRQRGTFFPEGNTDELEARSDHIDLFALVEEAGREISLDAVDVLLWILDRKWERHGHHIRPSVTRAQRIFHMECEWETGRTTNAWQELSDWWPEAAFSFA